MTKILYVNGCSHAAGSEIEGPEIYISDFNKLNCWGELLKNKLNYDLCINESFPGSSNARIYRTTILYIINYINKKLPLDDLSVIISWSSSIRSEVVYKDKYYNLNPYTNFNVKTPKEIKDLFPYYVKFLTNEKYRYELWNLQILQIQAFLEKLNIKYLFFNAIDELNDNKMYNNIINTKKYYHPYNNKKTYYNNLNLKKFTHGHSKRMHFMKDAHKYWCDILFNYIKDNDILGDI